MGMGNTVRAHTRPRSAEHRRAYRRSGLLRNGRCTETPLWQTLTRDPPSDLNEIHCSHCLVLRLPLKQPLASSVRAGQTAQAHCSKLCSQLVVQISTDFSSHGRSQRAQGPLVSSSPLLVLSPSPPLPFSASFNHVYTKVNFLIMVLRTFNLI